MLKEKKEWIDAMRHPSEHPSLQTGEAGETGEMKEKKSVESELQEVRERIAVKIKKMYEK